MVYRSLREYTASLEILLEWFDKIPDTQNARNNLQEEIKHYRALASDIYLSVEANWGKTVEYVSLEDRKRANSTDFNN